MMHALHHVGYWVDDLDAAMKQWEKDLGVGPFQVIDPVPFDTFVLTVDGERYDDVVFEHAAAFAAWGPVVVEHHVVFEHAAAFAAWGPVVVELGRVRAIDDRLAAAYGVAPGAVSHVSWVVPDLQQESARLERLGCRLINTARSGPINVAWHDGGPLFPHPIEAHEHNDVIAAMHGRLLDLRAPSHRLPPTPRSGRT